MITRRRSLIVVAESTPGTAVALGTTAIGVHQPASTPQTPYLEREPTSGGGRIAGITGARSRQATFGLHLATKTAGGNPVWASQLLPILGFFESGGLWRPTSIPPGGGAGAQLTATVGVNEDGRRHVIAGAMGTMEISATSGGLVEARVTLTGKDNGPPTATALVTETFPSGELPIRFAPATLTIGGNAMSLAEFSLSLGNAVQLRESAAEATGYIAAQVVDRNITGTFTIEAKTPSGTYQPHANFFSNTTQAAVLTIGSGDSALIITMPLMQLSNVPAADRNNAVYDQWQFVCTRTQAADDDIVIDFGV